MTIKEINNSEIISSWVNSEEAKQRGYRQDDLFDALFTVTTFGRVLRNAEPNELPF